ncbi:MAG: EF-hand domain-containing protein [Ramlibacter sp.]|nr:EF-hand domain-containing protein [Ramlibacter sp.]
MKIRSLLLLPALCMATAWVVAQTLPPTAPPLPAAQPAPAAAPLPAARWTAAQVREAFDRADSDSNGELSRAEAQRLAILPRSFEDMDQNKDGVLVWAEYEGAFPR